MPLSDFRDTHSWQEAIELSPSLVNLAEQLPASEENGLSFRLRKAMVDLPAAIAYDQGEGNSFSRKIQITRLAAMLDIIDKVYPALDTAVARKGLDQIVSHLRPEPAADKPTHDEAVADLDTGHPEAASHAGPVPDPSAVPVVPEGEPEPPAPAPDSAESSAVPTHITVEPAPEHPEST